MKLSYYYHNHENSIFVSMLFYGCIILCTFSICGYFMNFQNLWEYYPHGISKIGDVKIEFILSLIGVFAAPIGCITGWIY